MCIYWTIDSNGVQDLIDPTRLSWSEITFSKDDSEVFNKRKIVHFLVKSALQKFKTPTNVTECYNYWQIVRALSYWHVPTQHSTVNVVSIECCSGTFMEAGWKINLEKPRLHSIQLVRKKRALVQIRTTRVDCPWDKGPPLSWAI